MDRDLPDRPDLAQLRRQAKQLLAAARAGDASAARRIAVVSDRLILSAAQLALAREHGFASWPRLKREVDRKTMLNTGDVAGLTRLLAAHPELARERVSSCYSDPDADVLSYLTVAPFHGLTDHDRVEDLVRVVLAAGAPVQGPNGGSELIGAASYGEVGIVRALIDAGADLEARDAIEVEGTALTHAVYFGNTEVVDVLVAAGARVHGIIEAAGVGDITAFLRPDLPATDLARALRAAAICERLAIVDELLATGLPVDAETLPIGLTALHWAARDGKPAAVRHLLDRGADPNRRDQEHGGTPLGWCRHRHAEQAGYRGLQPGHTEVEEILEPLTLPT